MEMLIVCHDCQFTPRQRIVYFTFYISQFDMLPVKAEQLQQPVTQDPALSRVSNYIVHGWPFTVGSELLLCFCRWEQLTTEAGCILCGVRVLIPAKFCKQILDELNAGHPGIIQIVFSSPTCVVARY